MAVDRSEWLLTINRNMPEQLLHDLFAGVAGAAGYHGSAVALVKEDGIEFRITLDTSNPPSDPAPQQFDNVDQSDTPNVAGPWELVIAWPVSAEGAGRIDELLDALAGELLDEDMDDAEEEGELFIVPVYGPDPKRLVTLALSACTSVNIAVESLTLRRRDN